MPSGDEAHLWDVETTLSNFEVDDESGLDSSEVDGIREANGGKFNELDKEDGKSMLELILEQFDDALVKILLASAVVSALIALQGAHAPRSGFNSLALTCFAECSRLCRQRQRSTRQAAP